ncbi:hypothetical protein O6H91_21G040900 [Diphasiastrum complanatum]|uniref:Uncharacterized protein n=1 Tax=Diphasiastrum complanatum TaxID=34168 RepID=A0ACC2AK17_DIPCM|nr:hypothetical protein O6H91_Y077200 [Diphasiastrum complanatum]KAJ7517812.1 hypothetical protein O6H91_21G040900 [Diphasiastrum complanatum]
MRELGHGAAGGGFFEGLASNSQQLDSELENDLEYSSSESDESDADVPDVNGQSPGSYSLPFEGETSHHFFNFGEEKENATSAMALTLPNPMASKSTNAYDAGNFPLAGQMGFKSGNLAKVLNQPIQAISVPNISPVEKQSIPKKSSPPFGGIEIKKDGNNSDSEVRRVPEMSGKANAAIAKAAHVPGPQASLPSRKRGGASTDKEHKRMKRLLRNRVSAQQARERKKAYLSELEVKSKELEQKNAELQERVSTLQRENFMLRQIVKNTTLKADGR